MAIKANAENDVRNGKGVRRPLFWEEMNDMEIL
jgi:hypothetical protein